MFVDLQRERHRLKFYSGCLVEWSGFGVVPPYKKMLRLLLFPSFLFMRHGKGVIIIGSQDFFPGVLYTTVCGLYVSLSRYVVGLWTTCKQRH